MASIRKRNDKYQARIHRRGVGFISKTFLTRSDALGWARKAEVNVERLALGPRCPTLGELVARYAEEVSPKKKSARSEKYILNAWKNSPFGSRSADSVTPALFARWRDERLAGGAAGSTVRNHLNTLSAVYRHAATEWGFHQLSNPVAQLKRPSPGKSRTRRVSDEEINALLSVTWSPSLAPLVRLAIHTGMRLSELLNLQWRHINLTTQTAYLPDTKNSHARTVPLSSGAVEIFTNLRRQVIQQLDGRVFDLTPHGATVSFARACRRLRKATAGTRATDLRFHDLRHEAVSRLFEQGLNPIEVASISGHRSIQMLARYTHLNAASLAKRLG
jgi:integrase